MLFLSDVVLRLFIHENEEAFVASQFCHDDCLKVVQVSVLEIDAHPASVVQTPHEHSKRISETGSWAT